MQDDDRIQEDPIEEIDIDLFNLSIDMTVEDNLVIDIDFDDVVDTKIIDSLPDEVFTDSDFYVDSESTDLEVSKKTDSEVAEILSESFLFTRSSLSKGIHEIITKIMSDSDSRIRDNSIVNLMQTTDIKTPKFLKSSDVNETYTRILNNDKINLEELYYSLSLQDGYKKDQAKFYEFSKWAGNILESRKRSKLVGSHLSEISSNSKTVIVESLLGNTDVLVNMYNNNDSESYCLFKEFLVVNNFLSQYKCQKCGDINSLPEKFITLIKVDKKNILFYKPAQCSCGCISILEDSVYKELIKKVRQTIIDLRPSKTRDIKDTCSYTPDTTYLLALLSPYFEISVKGSSTDDKESALSSICSVDYDWESICNEFKDFILMTGDSKFKIYTNSVSNSAKILANQVNVYTTLKESSLASLINTLDKIGLFKFSLKNKSYYRIYSNVTDVDTIPQQALENLVDSLNINVMKDSKINKTLLKESLSRIKFMNDNFDSELDKYLSDLKEYEYFLSYVPISSSSLREDLVYNYLYDPKIYKVLDEISDQMILNHLAEDLFNNLSLTEMKKGKIQANVKLKNLKNKLLELNRTKPMEERTRSLSLSLGCYSSNIVLDIFTDSDSVNNLSNFYTACYKKDVYDIYKYHRCLTDLPLPKISNTELDLIFTSIHYLKPREIESDKFSFYFDFDCDVSYRVKFVRIYEEKGFVPKIMKGDTIDEKITYYENLETSEDNKDFIDSDLQKYLVFGSKIINFGRFINYSNLYENYVSYMYMRDVLFYMSRNNVSGIIKLLSVEPEVCTILLEDGFNKPVINPSVLEQFDILCMPVFDFDLYSIQQDKSLSLSDRIRIMNDKLSELLLEYKDLPELEKYLKEIIGEVIDGNSAFRG